MSVHGQVPYTKSIKVLVAAVSSPITYKNEKQEVKQLVNAAVADQTKAVKCTVYDSSKFGKFVEGAFLILRNVIKKNDGIVVTAATKVFGSPQFPVPDSLRTEGRQIVNPPAARMTTVAEALLSPQKTRVSIMAKIIQEEAVREVQVKSEPVKIKTVVVEDGSSKCKVTLWRQLATDSNIRAGDWVKITDVVTNSFRNEVSLQTTSRTIINITDAPLEEVTHDVVGVTKEEEEFSFITLLDEMVSVPAAMVMEQFPEVEEGNLEDTLIAMCQPYLRLVVTSRGRDILSISFI